MSGPVLPPPERDPSRILRSLGINLKTGATITPLAGGWSGGSIFRVVPDDPQAAPLVLRILPWGGPGPAREAAIHQLVRHHGIPAPEIVAIGPIAEGSGGVAMVMPFMPGIPLADILLRETPDLATAATWGDHVGTMLARIHAIPLAESAALDIPSWLTWMPISPAVMPALDPWLASAACDPAHARLLHLDYHPANLLGDLATVGMTAVLDWTNARLGPPIADLARTRSILRLVSFIGMPPRAQSILPAFADGLLHGWERQCGPVDPAMLRACDAWALDAQLADLAPKRTMPNTWVTESLLATLRDARDEAIAASLDDR